MNEYVVLFQFLSFFLLLVLGYGIGGWIERRHYASIIAREQRMNALPAIASRRAPAEGRFAPHLVSGSTVISVDYFKRFVGRLRMVFGGRLSGYESLLDRARRESVLRMKSEAQALGARYVFNVKYETASISKGRGDAIGCVEVLAYGTALVPMGEAPGP